MARFGDRRDWLLDAWDPTPRGPRVWQRPGVATSSEQAGAQVHFPPIANGLDYLLSVTKHLVVDDEDATVTERALKYAILHLAAGAEVLTG
ncbi:hypothetical protein [Streptomyces sp. NPDC002671]